jgi:DUF2971 family protein
MHYDKKPGSIFKFYPYNEWSLTSLVNKGIWFSPSSKFNDPFDCNISLQEEISGADFRKFEEGKEKISSGSLADRKKLWLPLLKEQYDHFRERTGIFCGSSNYKNNLMWSHYADNHRGFCIEIELERQFLDGAQSAYHQYLEVTYGPYPQESYWNACFNSDVAEGIARLSTLFSYKSKEWCYENEWRLFTVLGENEIGKMMDIPGTIVSAKFGLKMPGEHRRTIATILGNSIPYEAAKKSDSDFKLEFAPIDFE